MRKVLQIILFLSSCIIFAQENAVYTLDIIYNYQHIVGCTSCATRASNNAYVGLTSSNGGRFNTDYITTENTLNLTFFEQRTLSIATAFSTEDFCAPSAPTYSDGFTGAFVNYCSQRRSSSIRNYALALGNTIEYGNSNSTDLENYSNGIKSYAKSWFLPYQPDRNISLSYCDAVFSREGFEVDDGFWEYLVQGEDWKPIEDPRYNNQYPLNASIQELDAILPEDLLPLGNIQFRFTLRASGSGSSNRFAAGTVDSGVQNSPKSRSRVISFYTVEFAPCSIALDNEVDPNPEVVSQVTCNGGTDGSIRLTFERELTTDELLQINLFSSGQSESVTLASLTREDFNGTRSYIYTGNLLSAGNYEMDWQLGDNSGGQLTPSSDRVSFTIEEPSVIQIDNIEETQISCNNILGNVLISASGGGYTSNPNVALEYGIVGDDNSWQTSPSFNLPQGAYTFIVRNLNNTFCQSEVSSQIQIAPFANPLQIDVIGTLPPTLESTSDGEITVLALGTSGLITYEIFSQSDLDNPIQSFTSGNSTYPFEGLATGEYTIVIRDGSGCAVSTNTIPLQAVPIPTIVLTDRNEITCEGNGDGSLDFTISGGVAPYSYRWITPTDEESGILLGNTYTANDLLAGSYELVVSSDGAREGAFASSGGIVVQDADSVILNVTPFDSSCNGANDAYFLLEVSGGIDYEYRLSGNPNWTALPNNGQIPVIPGQFYSVLVRNELLCESNLVQNISAAEPDAIVITEIINSHVDNTIIDGTAGILEILIENNNGLGTTTWLRNNLPFTPPGGSTNTRLVNLPAGLYTVLFTDNNGCEGNLDVIIREPEELNIIGQPELISPVICNNGNNASIGVTVVGTGEITYTWQRNGADFRVVLGNNVLENVSEGTYSVVVSDESGQTRISEDIVVINPPEIQAEFTFVDITCIGGNDGSITVTATGGTGALQYEISPGFAVQDTPGTFINLESGTYEITVTDANDCSVVLTDITIDPGTQLDFIDTITPVSTPGGVDGAISVDVQGGTQPYFYRWTGPTGQITPVNTPPNTTIIENLPAGVYTLEVSNTDEFIPNGCYLSQPFTVVEQDAFNLQQLVPTPACFASNTGSIMATIEATGPVDFNWFNVNDVGNPLLTQTTIERTVTFDGLAPGTFYLEIENIEGQVVRSADVTVIELPEIDIAVIVQPSCEDLATGTIDFNPQGAFIDRYSYSIDGGATFLNTPIFENLEAADYNLIIRVDNNEACELALPGVVIPDSPPILYDALNTQITRASGPGASDGAITPIFDQGTQPLTYQWDANANNAITQNVVGLLAGNYTVTVTDAAGCFIVQDFEVTEVGPLTITNIDATDALCLGEANGSIVTTVTGEEPIDYVWTLANGNPVPISNGINGPNITGILSGSYRLTVTDDNSTVISRIIDVNQPATEVTITNIVPTDITCSGGNDGSLFIEAAGGTAPYTYSLNGGAFQGAPLFTQLVADDYTVSVQDANGCVFTEVMPLLLLEPDPLNIIINNQVPVTAANQSDGAILITVEGGSGVYAYEWTGPNGFTSAEQDIENIEAGDYILTVTDANFAVNNDAGCVLVSNIITVTEPGQLILTMEQTFALECSGDDDAQITATVQGGVLPYNYQWFQILNGNNVTLQDDTDTIGNLSAGSYFLRITDENGISIDSEVLEVTQPNMLQITVDNTTDVLCAGQPTGAIAISVSGGTAPYQYVWSNGATVANINALDAGEYTVGVEDANNCFSELTITVSAPDDALQIVEATVENVTAYQGSDGRVQLDVSGGLAPYTYVWTRASDNFNLGDAATITNLVADSYSVLISDANGCEVTETYIVTQPDIVVETLVPPSCTDSADGSISVLVNFGNGDFSYLWSTGATENTITNVIAGSYTVTITGFETGPITRTYTLENPEPIAVDLGDDRVLCVGQTLELDATVADTTATYVWTSDNGFTSINPVVTLSETGNYTLVVQTETGCTAEGSVSVTVSTDEIDAEFAVSTQAFVDETLIAVDISFPLPEGVEWIIPLGATVVSQNTDAVEFSFTAVGEYEITLITTRGGCVAQQTKKVLVVARDGLITEEDVKNNSKLVEDFIVYPNPTSGRFTTDINLSERGEVGIKIFSFANNALVASHKDRGAETYSIPFNISGMPSGVYAVLLETSYGTSLRKIVIR